MDLFKLVRGIGWVIAGVVVLFVLYVLVVAPAYAWFCELRASKTRWDAFGETMLNIVKSVRHVLAALCWLLGAGVVGACIYFGWTFVGLNRGWAIELIAIVVTAVLVFSVVLLVSFAWDSVTDIWGLWRKRKGVLKHA